MLILYIPLTLTSLFCTTSPSFILPAVRCYFDLTPLEEGSLFGAVYVGKFLNISIVILLVQSWCGTLSWKSVVTDISYTELYVGLCTVYLYCIYYKHVLLTLFLFFCRYGFECFFMGFSHWYVGKTKTIILWNTVEWNYGVSLGTRSKILGVSYSQVLLWSRVSVSYSLIWSDGV